MTTRMTKVVMMTMSYLDFPAKSVSVLMRSVAFGDYHNEKTVLETGLCRKYSQNVQKKIQKPLEAVETWS